MVADDADPFIQEVFFKGSTYAGASSSVSFTIVKCGAEEIVTQEGDWLEKEFTYSIGQGTWGLDYGVIEQWKLMSYVWFDTSGSD